MPGTSKSVRKGFFTLASFTLLLNNVSSMSKTYIAILKYVSPILYAHLMHIVDLNQQNGQFAMT